MARMDRYKKGKQQQAMRPRYPDEYEYEQAFMRPQQAEYTPYPDQVYEAEEETEYTPSYPQMGYQAPNYQIYDSGKGKRRLSNALWGLIEVGS